MKNSLFHVRIWKQINKPVTIVQRVQAPSEAQAIVSLMKSSRLVSADRVWVSRDTDSPPVMRVVNVFIKGSYRSWKHDITPLPSPR